MAAARDASEERGTEANGNSGGRTSPRRRGRDRRGVDAKSGGGNGSRGTHGRRREREAGNARAEEPLTCAACLRGTALLLFGDENDDESAPNGSRGGSSGSNSGRKAKDAPGRYLVTNAAGVSSTAALGEPYTVLEAGTFVDVSELVHGVKEQRLRGRIVEPPGWISILDTSAEDPFRWAERQVDEADSADATSGSGGRRGNLVLDCPPIGCTGLELQVLRVDFAKGSGPWTSDNPQRNMFAPKVVLRVELPTRDGAVDVVADDAGAFPQLNPEHPLCQAGARGLLLVGDGSGTAGRCKVLVGRSDSSPGAAPAGLVPESTLHTVLLQERGDRPRRTLGEIELSARWLVAAPNEAAPASPAKEGSSAAEKPADPKPLFQEFDRRRGFLLLAPPPPPPAGANGMTLELQVLRVARDGSTWSGMGLAAALTEAFPLDASLVEKPGDGQREALRAEKDGRFRPLRPDSPLLSGGDAASGILQVAAGGVRGTEAAGCCGVLVDRSLPCSSRAQAHTALLLASTGEDASKLADAPAVGEITVRACWVPDAAGT
eukprot:TRINITY_DN36951_c0_g1_i1.p1 TRINITY_DN36951_c0_g1~~TRINITY_DN36951_c0_g1_i1.p1  ORF type:complete len:568 (-),score=120.16 TRINITY_DN36951_c0_g1_i1:76-1719(-)